MTTAPAIAPENVLVAGLERLPVHPTALVIFGATGDLARRKLLPAVYNLAHDGALPERFELIGSSRSEMSDLEFRTMMAEAVRAFSRRRPDRDVLEKLLEDVRYVPGAFDDPAVFDAIGETLDDLDAAEETPLNRCFYL